MRPWFVLSRQKSDSKGQGNDFTINQPIRIFSKLSSLVIAIGLILWIRASISTSHAEDSSTLSSRIIVIIPDFEVSPLVDPQHSSPEGELIQVWGNNPTWRRPELFYALRLPNRLIPAASWAQNRPEAYEPLVSLLKRRHSSHPQYRPHTINRDLFIFNYDWRQEIATQLAPRLGLSLDNYASQHSVMIGKPGQSPHFVVIAHGFGGLIFRTLLSQRPRLAEQIDQLYLVGVPNLGTATALLRLVAGEGFSFRSEENNTWWQPSARRISPQSIKLVSMTWPSLFEMLPLKDLHWEKNQNGRAFRIASDDLLTTGTWSDVWASPAFEAQEYGDVWKAKFMGDPEEPQKPDEWDYCDRENKSNLQNILVQVRDWRLQMGTLTYTNQLLTRPGETGRLRLVVGRGVKTPTGVIMEGTGDMIQARPIFAPDADGDGIVTVESILEDLKNPDQIITLIQLRHEQLLTGKRFTDQLLTDLSLLENMN